ncbi:MAG: hypothetical protein QME63_03090, partial [Actinomycetota bacterium]|nr:hypothetical protein [Actinomycetota bacterium]
GDCHGTFSASQQALAISNKEQTGDGGRTENKHVIGGISDFMLLLNPYTEKCRRILNKGD